MDDVAVPVYAHDCQSLLEKIQMAATAVDQVASSLGLEVNTKPGKTEAVLLLAGRGSERARSQLLDCIRDVDEIPLWPFLGR